MSGPTLTWMAPAVDARFRSHSTPDLLSALPKPLPTPATTDSRPLHRANTFKELPSLPAFDVPSFDIAEFESALRFDRDSKPARRSLVQEKVVEVRADTPPSAAANIVAEDERSGGTKSMIDRPRSWLPSSKSSPNVRAAQVERPKSLVKDNAEAVPDDPQPGRLERSRTVESFADFAKRSWISSSRSPSPPSRADRTNGASKSKLGLRSRADSGSRLAATSDLDDENRAGGSPNSKSRALNRASIYLTRIKQKPQNVFTKSASSSSLPSLVSTPDKKPKATSLSSTNLLTAASTTTTSVVTKSTTTPAAPGKLESIAIGGDNDSRSSVASSSTPRNSSHTASSVDSVTTENASQSTADTGITMPHPTSRDPLWNAFRILDTDFAKFSAKVTTPARMGILRTSLIPFLRSTSYHPSNTDRSVLTPEDIDRRATILDQWWNGLLDMLSLGHPSKPFANTFTPTLMSVAAAGQFSNMPVSLQPVSGADRPTLLEATTMIMARPEWRLCTTSFQPLAERSPEERVRARSGTQSTCGSEMEFLAESAEHNVRNLLISNLVRQVSIAVEKMSLRHAPLSLVNWCGKVLAYAFFFAPGVADVLVRLWSLSADLLRRVADEFGLPRKNNGESEDIVALFPPHLGKLGWTSAKELGDKLRQATRLSLSLAKIPWHGPWVPKWRGGETDLFYIFCKYYHILAEEFIPEGLPLLEKARGPGFVLVHAQLLSVMDSTIHRQASIDAMLPLSDGPYGADATMTGISLPSNLMKSMEENRVIILLKDMLSDTSVGVSSGIKHTFAQAFVSVLKAATKRTSQYDHAACFTLCDFLEVALTVLDSFQNGVNNNVATSPAEGASSSFTLDMAGSTRYIEYVDWPFWFDVGKMISESNNTMSEIRVMAFVFSLWDAITTDPARKEALCLEWLLSEEVFEKFFNNWCPMVRAYYMRLLCWRVCRDSGSANELDTKIFLVVSQRLRTVWSHYLWGKQNAEARGRMPPSTAPCYPTPGKRFLIIRTEVQPQQPVLTGFDVLPGSLGSDTATDFRGVYLGGENSAEGGRSDGALTSYKKKWTLLGKVLSFTTQQASSGGGNSNAKRSWDEELEQARRETAAARSAAARSSQSGLLQAAGPPPPPKQAPSSGIISSSDSGSSTGSTPVYDAVTFVFRFTLSWGGQNGAHPPRDRILSRPRLPAPAHARVSARAAALNGFGRPSLDSTFRSESPPPIAPGLPPETRRISGLMQTGLISEARNARPLSFNESLSRSPAEKAELKRLSLNIDITSVRPVGEGSEEDPRLATRSPTPVSSSFDGYESDRGRSFDIDGERGRPQFPAVRAVKPVGIYASGAVYSGRALAEWSLVVSECNSFVERRRDEGVLGLSDVEVPALSVDGLGLRQRG
ncbi:hypothetical protein B0T16DRAFT_451389 [Cercophora newfieldiana]|uniref:DUF1765-domain-containing protein n=1 Tax=Cercophora newfieldiana TaxID=92897 RepID=A0AA39YNE4_9PEZI|nr:hypothetical protein B0T16DRAFT_451389 [Cercophora newfieldiana]